MSTVTITATHPNAEEVDVFETIGILTTLGFNVFDILTQEGGEAGEPADRLG